MACSNTVKLVSHPLHQKEHGVVHGGRLAPVHVPKLIPTTQTVSAVYRSYTINCDILPISVHTLCC